MKARLSTVPKKVVRVSKKVLKAPKIVLNMPKDILELSLDMSFDLLNTSMDIFDDPRKIAQVPKQLSRMPVRMLNQVIKTFLILSEEFKDSSFLDQETLLIGLINRGKKTVFGIKYGFKRIKTIQDFQQQVPISHYHDFEPWIHCMLKGEKNITYPGRVDRFATSSGTTGGTSKYIPISKENLKLSHFKGGLTALGLYTKNNPRSQFFTGKGLVLGGGFAKNPYTGEDNVGFISAILQKTAPWIGQYFRAPSSDISFMENREEKTKKIIETTLNQKITFINGQPSWISNLMYKILAHTGKSNILEVWPHLEFFFRGGMSIDLYRDQFAALFPSSKFKYYQVYNASEGFFAVQDTNYADDMLLLTNHGVFYEFIPLAEYGSENPTVLTLEHVEKDKEYVIVITNNSGLWRYVLGDTVRFTCLDPRRIKVSGRTKYFIDVVGECVTSEYTDKALLETCKKTDSIASDYTVGPITYIGGHIRGAYEWIVEFAKQPHDMDEFAKILDHELGQIQSYYNDERHDTKVLGVPVVHAVSQGTFYNRLKKKNKLGGQHKVPKIRNDRGILNELLCIIHE